MCEFEILGVIAVMVLAFILCFFFIGIFITKMFERVGDDETWIYGPRNSHTRRKSSGGRLSKSRLSNIHRRRSLYAAAAYEGQAKYKPTHADEDETHDYSDDDDDVRDKHSHLVSKLGIASRIRDDHPAYKRGNGNNDDEESINSRNLGLNHAVEWRILCCM